MAARPSPGLGLAGLGVEHAPRPDIRGRRCCHRLPAGIA